MPIAAPIQNVFNAGEFSPIAYGRTDYPKYKNGLALLKNFIPMVQGGATRRTGTKHVQRTKNKGQARLLPFVFSTGDAFVLEVGDQYLRFHTNYAPVLLATQAITGITQANPAVISYSGSDTFANGDEVYVAGIVGMTEMNGKFIKVANVDTGANTFEATDQDGVNINSLGFTAYASGGTIGEIYEIASPYLLADIYNLRIFQLRDIVYIVHPSYPPKKLSRSALTSWAFATVAFLDGPYMAVNATATTLTPAAATGTNILVTASAITGINGGVGFQASDVGRSIRLRDSTHWGWAIIKTFNTTTTVHVDIQSDFDGTGASAFWRLGEWSDTTGYPSTIGSFENRLGFAASTVAPETLNLSNSNDYENMAPTQIDGTVIASNALQLPLNSGQQDPIRWFTDDEKGLMVGTKGAEWVARSSLTGEAMSAINYPSAKRASHHGSAFIEPIDAGKSILFVQTSLQKIREMAYVYQVDGFQAPDMTILSEHITKPGIAELAYQKEPFSLAWARLTDGSLKCMTYDRDNNVFGWHRHSLGGFSDAGHTLDPIVESITCIPSADGTQDDLWLIVKRYVNGQTVRTIEYLSAFNTAYTNVANCFFVDGGKTVTLGAPGTVVRGFEHMLGETATILQDGSPVASALVALDGTITVDNPGTVFNIGFGYTSRIQTLRSDAGSATGTAQGKIKRVHKLAVMLHQTVGLRFGIDFDNMDREEFRKASDPMNQPVPMFDGIKILAPVSNYDFDGYVCLEQDQPLPMTLLAIMPQLHTQDAQ